MNCRLCFSDNNELFDIYGDEGKNLRVEIILKKHFGWIKFISNDPYSQYVCKHCWANVSDFNTFYCEIEKKQTRSHPIETNYLLVTEKVPGDDRNLINDPKHEVKTEASDNEFGFEFDGEEVVSAIKAELTIKMSEDDDDEDDEEDQDYTGLDDDVMATQDSSDSDDDNFLVAKSSKKKSKPSRTHKSKSEITKKEKPVKDAATRKKQKAIADKCKKSNEWGDAQEANIKQLCKMECTICPNQPFDKWLDMKKHYRIAHQVQGFVICSCCDGKFTKRFKILDHVVRKLNPEEFKCKICNKYYENRDSLGHHMGYHEPEESRPYKCDVEDCLKTFTRRSQFLDHQIRHTPESEKKFQCGECGKRFATANHLKYHAKRQHDRAFHKICERCGKSCESKLVYERHIKRVHEANLPSEKLQCHICEKWFNRENFQKHMTNLHIKVEVPCPQCGKIVRNQQALKNHIRYTHTQPKFECTVCKKMFKKAISLKEHMTQHTNEILYTCLYCPKTFNSHANRCSHVKKLHPIEWEEARRLRMQP